LFFPKILLLKFGRKNSPIPIKNISVKPGPRPASVWEAAGSNKIERKIPKKTSTVGRYINNAI